MKKFFTSIFFLFMPLRVLLVLALLVVALPITASASEDRIDNLSVTIDVKKDGSAEIVENFDIIDNSPWWYFFRNIPLRYKVANENYVSTIVFNVDVKRNGEKVPFVVNRQNNKAYIRIGNAFTRIRPPQSYTIKYSVYPVFYFDKEKDIFKWNIIDRQGIDYDLKSISNIKLFIKFPIGANINNHKFLIGKEEITNNYEFFHVSNNELKFFYNKAFSSHLDVSLLIDFDKGIFKEKTIGRKLFYLIKRFSNELLIILSVLLVSALFDYISKKDDYQTFPVRYYPPENITPVLFGYLLNDNLEPNEAISIIFHWATKKYLTVYKDEKNNEMYIVKLKEMDSNIEKDYEKRIFDVLFQDGDKVSLTKLESLANKLVVENERKRHSFEIMKLKAEMKNCNIPTMSLEHREEENLESNFNMGKQNFWKTFTRLRYDVKRDLEEMGVYANNPKGISRLTFWMLTILVFSYFLFMNLGGTESFNIYFLLGVIILCAFFTRRRKKTPYGRKLYAEIKGFEEFLKKVENPQIETLMKNDVDYCNKILPYAIVAGVKNELLIKMKKLFKFVSY